MKAEANPTQATEDADRAITVEELSGRWAVSAKTINRMIKRRELPHFRVGRQLRIRLCDVLGYEKKNLR